MPLFAVFLCQWVDQIQRAPLRVLLSLRFSVPLPLHRGAWIRVVIRLAPRCMLGAQDPPRLLHFQQLPFFPPVSLKLTSFPDVPLSRLKRSAPFDNKSRALNEFTAHMQNLIWLTSKIEVVFAQRRLRA